LTVPLIMHRSKGDSAVFVLDAKTSECVHYEPLIGFPPVKMARVPHELLEWHPELGVRNDLIDCNIDVCSVEMCHPANSSLGLAD
jgi:translation initiation factor eIF-2B subunit epsilon